MGWNTGFRIFEATVIGAYDLGKLDKALLSALMEPYRGTDIDSGGSRNLTSKDGKEIQQIVVEAWGLEIPQKPQEGDHDDVWEGYYALIGERMDIVTNHFGWE